MRCSDIKNVSPSIRQYQMKSNVLKQKSLLQRENMMPSEKNFMRIGGLEETMERLTKRIDGWVMRKGCHGICRACTGAECADLYPMIDRLADYEDTGLTPEEVKALVPTPNDPLTLEELREMGLFEWLWVEVIHPTKSQLLREVESAYYQVFEDYTDGDAICCGWPGLIHDFAYDDYGKNWLAYRRKPEEEARRDA